MHVKLEDGLNTDFLQCAMCNILVPVDLYFAYLLKEYFWAGETHAKSQIRDWLGMSNGT